MRLIDADAFREGILAQSITGKESYSTDLICDFVDEQPTAYDVDKVVERLENASWWTQSTFDEDGYSNDDSEEVVDLYRAIEIVEAGGADER